MTTFTLDTNCIIDIADSRPAKPHVLELARAHAEGKADVAIAAVSASERQQGDIYLDSYNVFRERLEALGLGHLTEIRGIAYWGISYWDQALYPTDEMSAREEIIHRVLFPSIPFFWADFAALANIAVDAIKDTKGKRWRNAFCDRQMFWAHDHAGRDVFVTSDANFIKLASHQDFPKAHIMTPSEAIRSL